MGFIIENGLLREYIKTPGETSVVVPNGVIKIAHGAFEYCAGIKSVSLPDSLLEIGGKAFCGCKKLTKINIPKSVERIGTDAFDETKLIEDLRKQAYKDYQDNKVDVLYCRTIIIDSALIEVKLPMYGSTIGNVYKREKVVFKVPEHITCIADNAFYDMERRETPKVVSIELPKGLKRIGYSSFNKCKSLTHIDIPEGVTSISDCAFLGCEKLESIDLPQGLEVIGEAAFSGCAKLRSVDIPDSVVRIDSSAFSGCKMLKNVNVNRDIPCVFADSFAGTKLIENIKKKSDFVMLGKTLLCSSQPVTGDLVIPEGVTVIAGRSFLGAKITSLTIPEGVTTICDQAFQDCEKITELKLPSTLRKIGTSVFLRCNNVSKLVIADNPYLELKNDQLYKKDSRRVKILTLKK